VIVWDWGTWELAETDDPLEAVADGSLHCDLHGAKLSGRFAPSGAANNYTQNAITRPYVAPSACDPVPAHPSRSRSHGTSSTTPIWTPSDGTSATFANACTPKVTRSRP
jgi:hypothetical protein